MLLALATAVLLRFWQLGHWPPGLYRDEAYNGLDALGVLNGEHSLYFTANNGREPAYIYLTALALALGGRSALTLRLAAAVVGSLTTWLVYRLGKAWFDGLVGLAAAWLWAVTLWPLHLSRIGLRAVLLPPLLAAAFWLGALAYRRGRPRLWLLAGLVYGAAFYTYLAVQFTPLLLLLLALYLLATGRGRALWPGLAWFGLGAAVALAPLLVFFAARPELVAGRAGQVSILNTAVNAGDLWGTLARNSARALGMFLWRGDLILRHNPAGRPLFDLFMALPFLLGVVWCLRHWRRPAAAATLLWTLTLLGPTILAADAPHFLRAVGVLPAALLLPALGLAALGRWAAARWSPGAGAALAAALALGSLAVTMRDYAAYGRDPQVGYLFEAAAAGLAAAVNAEAPETAVWLDARFWSGWPSIPFLVADGARAQRYTLPDGPPPAAGPVTLYAWPYESLDFVPQALPPPVRVAVDVGPLARNDLETTAYPLYVRYAARPAEADPAPPAARFGERLALQAAALTLHGEGRLEVALIWEADTAVTQPLTVFVHVVGPEGLLAQDDGPLAHGYWPPRWLRAGLSVQERRLIDLPEPFDPARHAVWIGLYDSVTLARLPARDASGAPLGDAWRWEP